MKKNNFVNNSFSNILKFKKSEKSILENTVLILFGVIFLTFLAQMKIFLPKNPVPVTLGTLGVSLIALFYGKKLGLMTVLTYVVAGFAGFPVFSSFTGGLLFSAAGGYILGYVVATFVLTFLIEKGFGKSFIKLIFALLIFYALIYTCGVLQLSLFVGAKNILAMGVLPFIFGDFLKILVATAIFKTLKK